MEDAIQHPSRLRRLAVHLSKLEATEIITNDCLRDAAEEEERETQTTSLAEKEENGISGQAKTPSGLMTPPASCSRGQE